jgi:5-methylcytosine-specific restriction endonuclease McrA
MGQFKMASLFKSFSKETSIPKKPKRIRKGKQPVATEPVPPVPKSSKKRKKQIPIALREQVWLKQMGKVFEGKCPTTWCQNTITVFDFQSGHNIPESKGGPTKLENLIPLCSRCNLSMGNDYTFDQWCEAFQDTPNSNAVAEVPVKKSWCCF